MWWIACAWAIPFDLPDSEQVSLWQAAFDLGGFEAAEFPESGPAVELTLGFAAELRVRDAKGNEHRAPIQPPADAEEREDIIWLAKSLLQPSLTTETPDRLPDPIPTRGRSIVPEWPRKFWFRLQPALAYRPTTSASFATTFEIGAEVFDAWNGSFFYRPQTPSRISGITGGIHGEGTFGIQASRLWGAGSWKWGTSFGPSLSVRRLETLSGSSRGMLGPVLGVEGYGHWELPWVQLEPVVRLDLDLFGTVLANGEDTRVVAPVRFSFGIAARIGLPPEKRKQR